MADMGKIVVCVMLVEFHLPGARSLKAKRALTSKIRQLLKNHSGIAVAEIDYQDLWQRSAFVFVAVGTSEARLNRSMDKVRGSLDRLQDLVVLREERDYR